MCTNVLYLHLPYQKPIDKKSCLTVANFRPFLNNVEYKYQQQLQYEINMQQQSKGVYLDEN